MSEFIGSIEIDNGYNGDKAIAYLVTQGDKTYAVWRGGFFVATGYHLEKLTTNN